MARKPTTAAPADKLTRKADDDHAHMLGCAIQWFKAKYPADWEALRLCPLQHGVEEIARKLKG